MKINCITIILVLVSITGYGQKCGTKFDAEYYDEVRSRYYKEMEVSFADKINRVVDVTVYIVGLDSSFANTVQADLDNNVNRLFEPIGLKFSICEVNLIKDYNFREMDNDLEKEMVNQYHTPNTINIYCVNFIPDACGYAYLPSSARDVIVMRRECFGNSTLVHEFGHFFGLFHTHEHTKGLEYVNGDECATRGDLICDTPADPDLSIGEPVNANCNYTATQTDVNGDYYAPLVSNIMSYAEYKSCKCSFTNGQYKRMVESYFLYKTHLRGAAFDVKL